MEGIMTITAELEELLQTILTDPGVNIPEAPQNYVYPNIATIREIDIQSSDGRLDAKFVGANYEVDLDEAGGLSQVLTRLATGRPTPFPMPDSLVQKRKFKTPLSLQNKVHSYIIIRLTGRNWQFSYDKAPFSVGIDGAKSEAYWQARKVDGQGRIVAPGTPTKDCRLAFFVSDGVKALGRLRRYSHGFNLHLDLKYKNSENEDSFMPIVIDPDVRYPGGSGLDADP
jgi:hypothetical protein